MTEAFPLYWPEGRPRTPNDKRIAARFDTGFGAACRAVYEEIRRLGGQSPVLSTNVPLRRDGLPLAAAKRPNDVGAAAYFFYKNRQMAFACDKWTIVEDNIYAIAKTIGAMRGIARWGTGDMVDAAFSGFTSLPPPKSAKRNWRDVLNLPHNVWHTRSAIIIEYKTLASRLHPDAGGTHEAMSELNAARDEALREKEGG